MTSDATITMPTTVMSICHQRSVQPPDLPLPEPSDHDRSMSSSLGPSSFHNRRRSCGSLGLFIARYRAMPVGTGPGTCVRPDVPRHVVWRIAFTISGRVWGEARACRDCCSRRLNQVRTLRPRLVDRFFYWVSARVPHPDKIE